MALDSRISRSNLFLNDKKENNKQRREKNEQRSIDQWRLVFCVCNFVDAVVDRRNAFVQKSNSVRFTRWPESRRNTHTHTHSRSQSWDAATANVSSAHSRIHQSTQQTQSETNAWTHKIRLFAVAVEQRNRCIANEFNDRKLAARRSFFFFVFDFVFMFFSLFLRFIFLVKLTQSWQKNESKGETFVEPLNQV